MARIVASSWTTSTARKRRRFVIFDIQMVSEAFSVVEPYINILHLFKPNPVLDNNCTTTTRCIYLFMICKDALCARSLLSSKHMFSSHEHYGLTVSFSHSV
jgi:hypothetical protein